MFSRKSWHAYFMDFAKVASTRSTCNRKHVGCVLVRDNRVIATGYNGSVAGLPHCDDVGHDIHNDHCVRTIHAEANAVYQAAKFGISTDGATAYVNTYPCWNCYKVLVGAGVGAIYYDANYRVDPRVEHAAKTIGVLVAKLEG